MSKELVRSSGDLLKLAGKSSDPEVRKLAGKITRVNNRLGDIVSAMSAEEIEKKKLRDSIREKCRKEMQRMNEISLRKKKLEEAMLLAIGERIAYYKELVETGQVSKKDLIQILQTGDNGFKKLQSAQEALLVESK